MKANQHIVWLTPGFAKDEQDSTCIPPMQAYFKAFKAQYPDVKLSVIALQYPHRSDEYQWNGITVYPCNGRGRKLYRFQTWRKARSYFQQLENVSLIHSFWFNEGAMLGNKWSRKAGIPHVCTLMGQDALPQNRYLKLVNKTLPTVVALSENHATTFEATTGKSADSIIPWGIENTTTSESQNERTIDVLGVGSLTKLKNYSLFIDCIAKLKTTLPNIKAVIAGEGPERESLQQQISDSQLTDNIELKGSLPREEVLDLMGQSKVFLHTSGYESFGYVFSEALSKGQFIVSFNVGNTFDTPQWNIITNPTEIKEKLQFLLEENPPEPIQVINYSIEDTVDRYANLYQNLTQQKTT
jgi:glycosyltransferase involved in cell wall biosynthesis